MRIAGPRAHARLGLSRSVTARATRIHDSAVPMMVVLAVVVAFVRLDPLGVAAPLGGAEVVGCDGQMVSLDGRDGNSTPAQRG